ncbi:threonine/serine exporter family protein [Virgibacillus proomii]|uniref:threonine/serine exporter family protein n=1 Tax=Virgibacillus proomii TaxID=84407 RepID=UPI001C1028C0|nr:threonine/serine exporter family protein [Virgibacillus proomii]MBU5267456.1 threonine/serine exporter family protein [Virgibacillus proomii]
MRFSIFQYIYCSALHAEGGNIITEQFYQASDILDICILAGGLMLKSRAETYRVEDTVTCIAHSYSISHVNVFVTPTAIIMTMDDPESPTCGGECVES